MKTDFRALASLILLVFIGLNITNCQTKSSKKTNPSTAMATTENNKIELSENEWKNKLSNEEYYILRQKGTERPYTGKFLMHKEKGMYTCAGCGNELFASDSKFDSHCGWPSFDKEISEGKIVETVDKSAGMIRTEITCARCGGHLGHVFDDGPTSTGLRYCVNSVSLGFEPEPASAKPQSETITLGGGCFWCTEAVFEEIKGVTKVESGYSGGFTKEINYEMISEGNTGHAEVIQISFDPSVVSIVEILRVFFTIHDPTTLNRQGADIGTQYRSCIYYHNEKQREISMEIIAQLKAEKAYSNDIVTEVMPIKGFVKAEDYHQNYFQNNKSKGYCKAVIQPKLDKFEKVFSHLKK